MGSRIAVVAAICLALTGCTGTPESWCGQFESVFNRAEAVILSPDPTRDELLAAYTDRQESLEAMDEPNDERLAEFHTDVVAMGASLVGGNGSVAWAFYSAAINVETRCGALGYPIRLMDAESVPS